MRHVPYSTSAGEEPVMAVSATAAESSWFGGHAANLHRFGGGIYGNNGGRIVDIIDGNGVGVAGSCASANSELVRSGSDIRNDSDAAVADDDDEKAYCDRATDDQYSRRLLLSALSVVPASRRTDWSFPRKKSHLIKSKRRPSLSNVIEINESGAVAKRCVLSELKRRCSGGDSGAGGDSSGEGGYVVENSKNSVLRDRVNGGDWFATCDTGKSTAEIVDDASAAATANGGGVTAAPADAGGDNREFVCAGNANERIREPLASPNEVAWNGQHKSWRPKSWYGEASYDKLNGVAVSNDTNYAWRRTSTFTSLPEDEDEIGEIGGVDGEERVVLLEQSVPNNEAFSTAPPAKGTATITTTSSTKIARSTTSSSSSLVDEAKISDAHSIPLLSSSATSAAVASASKLGKWSKSKIDLLVPSLKSLVTMTTNKLSASKPANPSNRRFSYAASNCPSSKFEVRAFGSPIPAALRRIVSLNTVANVGVGGGGVGGDSHKNASSDNIADMYLLNKSLRKCNTVLTLTSCRNRSSLTSSGTVQVEPLHPFNRLREDAVPVRSLCSRCSSILSMASSSRYSLNSAYGFVPVSSPSVLCKVCLNEVPLKDSWTLQHCDCSYCVDCVRSYVEFEINQGAYSISCPDAQCEKQGIILLEEIESLVSFENVEKHKRYRLNKEVEMDRSRTWCPRAGCETVCTLRSTDRCTPQSVHCPTCSMDFCSNCRAAWHEGSPCKSEEAVPGVTFDSELIKCCPMCSVPIEKDEGCAQMLCKRCKHVFCWYCLASLDDDFLLRHYDKGPCKNKLGHSRASVIWHRTQVISIFAGFGILLLIASPLLLLAAPCIVCCKCRVCSSDTKLDVDDDIPEAAELHTNSDPSTDKDLEEPVSNALS